SNRFGFVRFDHITSNFQTMSPALLWLEHVLGFQRFWDVAFHTRDVAAEIRDGSGLRSVVMWDPGSGVKFANNEPYRPNFKRSQINVFHEEHRGDGVQHLALEVRDILEAVRALRARGVEFMPTPAAYYDRLPERLAQLGIDRIDEPLEALRELEILVDGHGKGSYLLQIFLKDSAGLYGNPEAGPFFYEIIQRKGDPGFGEGNFRALFESIERAQTKGEAPGSSGASKATSRRSLTSRSAARMGLCATSSASRDRASTGRTPSSTTSGGPTRAARVGPRAAFPCRRRARSRRSRGGIIARARCR